jgi:hypothetical protein
MPQERRWSRIVKPGIRQKRTEGGSGTRGPGLVTVLIACAAIAAAAAAAYFMLGRRAAPDSQAQTAGIDFQALKGRWLRPDGGYVLDIRNVDPEGRIDAAYFNPRPINVSRAGVSRQGDGMNVFVELRDTGYPGCTYTMVYNPQEDSLKGVYYQAEIQESFEIVFVRMK